MKSGDWVTRMSQVHAFARENDGQCVVAIVPYFEDGKSAPCVFRDPDEARRDGEPSLWLWYFSDEPECFPCDDYSLVEDR